METVRAEIQPLFRPAEWRGVIHGVIESKSNSRQIVKIGKKTALVKSKAAREWFASAVVQAKAVACDPLLSGRLVGYARVYYPDERRDLDVELLWDALQGVVYHNDRQVREKHVWHFIDKRRPRVEVLIKEITQ